MNKHSILIFAFIALSAFMLFPAAAQDTAPAAKSPSLSGSQNAKTIPIAIPDMAAFGDSNPQGEKKEIIETYTSFITTEVASIPYFQVLERQRANEIYAEVSYQLLQGGEISSAVMNTKMSGACALLLTGCGELYGKIVITARLVDMQNGRILLASTIYSDQENILSALRQLTASIREKGGELGMTVTLDDVNRAIKAKSWKEAKRLIDSYMRDHPSDPEARGLYTSIAQKRAEELYRDSIKSVRMRLFQEAREAVDEAIALVPDGRYYAQRDAIATAEIDYQYQQKAEAARREERLKNGQSTETFWTQIDESMSRMTAAETRLGVAYLPLMSTPDLSVDFANADWGLALGWTIPLRRKGNEGSVHWTLPLGLNFNYERVGDSGMGFMGQFWASPLLSESIQLGPVFLSFDLDGGLFFKYGPFEGDSWRFGCTAGGSIEMAARISASKGIYIQARPEWRFYIDDASRSGPCLMLCSGITL